jgi:hypothetical protein
VNKLTAGPAVDPAALGDEVHEAKKGDRNGKREDSGNVGVHELFLNEFCVLTQNAAFECGIFIHQIHYGA